YLNQATVGGTTTSAGNRLRDDVRRGVCSQVLHLRTGVLELAFASKRYGENFALSVRPHHPYRWVLHGDLGADVAIDPFHGADLFYLGALGHQVVDVVGPVLNGGVAAAATLLHDDLNDCRVQGVRLVDRCSTALYVVHVGILINNDQGAFELTHVRSVNTEVRLLLNVNMDYWWNVDKGAAGPHSRVQRRELVVTSWDYGTEVLLEHLRVFLQSGVGLQEANALLLQVLADLVVDNL